MKIAIVTNPMPKTNSSPLNSVTKLINILPKDSCVKLFTLGYENINLKPMVGNFSLITFKRHKNLFDFGKKQRLLFKEIHIFSPDVVLFWIGDKMLKVMSLCKKNNFKTIMWVYGNTFPYISNILKKIYSIFVFNKMLLKCDYVAEESPGVIDLYGNLFHYKKIAKKCKFNNLSIYTDYFDNNIKKFEERDDSIVLVTRLAKEKNVEATLEGLLNRSLTKNFKIIVIGSGPMERYLKEKFSKNPVVFSGWQNKEYIQSVLSNSKAFIINSYTEGFPSSVQEAIACGSVIIAAPVGGLSSFINNENSVIISNSSSKGVSLAFEKFLSLSIEEANSLIMKAFNDLDSNFSYINCQKKMKKVLSEVKY